MYDTVLVPTDGSDGVDEALEHALGVATADATIHALYVVDRRLYFAADENDRDAVRERLESEGNGAVEHVASIAEQAGVQTETAIREGYPDRDIVDYADEHDADVIVIGTHGRTGRERLANMGSVTERVVENAGRPVLVVHIGE
ncbi:MAG: universal stress protein [Halobacteriota archaeon]